MAKQVLGGRVVDIPTSIDTRSEQIIAYTRGALRRGETLEIYPNPNDTKLEVTKIGLGGKVTARGNVSVHHKAQLSSAMLAIDRMLASLRR